MVKVSIICLIYKSTKLADWVYKSIINYTPMLYKGEAEFFFVANDPTDIVVNHLIENNYPFILNENEVLSEEKLFNQGYGMPEYMNRVYKGYNQGILHAKGERIALINSDNYFSPDWLENLLKYSTFKNVVCTELIEPGHEKFLFFPTALRANFGKTTTSFEEEKFIDYVMKNKKTGLKKGGAYMPCILYKEMAIYAGLYPEGNIAGDNYQSVVRFGDEYFYDNLKKLGVDHYTAMDSFAYHLKEGEKDNNEDSFIEINQQVKDRYRVKSYNKPNKLQYYNLNVDLVSSLTYESIIKNLILDNSDIGEKENDSKESENLNNINSMLDERVDSIDERVDIFNERVDSIDERVDIFNERVDSIDEQVDIFNERIDSTDELVGIFNERIDSINDRVSIVTERVDSIDEQVDIFNERIDSINDRVSIVTERVDSIDNRVNVVTERVDSIDNRVNVVTERVDSIDNRVNVVTERVGSIDNRVNIAAERVDTINNKIDKLVNTIVWWIPVRKWRYNFREKFK